MRSHFQARAAAVRFTGADIIALHGGAAFRSGPRHAKLLCPAHAEETPSLSIDLASGRAHCFGCGAAAGDAVALHRLLGGFATQGAALADLEQRTGQALPPLKLKAAVAQNGASGARPTGMPVVVRMWRYLRADGTVAFVVKRVQFRQPDGSWAVKASTGKPAKIFWASAPDGSTQAMPAGFDRPGSRPLYRLPELLAAPAGRWIWVCEGEKAVDALVALGWLATTSSGGASAAEKTDWSPLAGRRVRVWPDADEAGERYAATVTGLLSALAPTPFIRHVDVTALGMGRGEDAADWAGRNNGESVT